jgi:hypothetical protein
MSNYIKKDSLRFLDDMSKETIQLFKKVADEFYTFTKFYRYQQYVCVKIIDKFFKLSMDNEELLKKELIFLDKNFKKIRNWYFIHK